MELIARSLGIFSANCYILRNEREILIIDPGGDPEIIYPCIGKRRLAYIINTHGHYDHIAANNELKARYDTKLAVGTNDAQMLMNPELNLSLITESPFISIAPDILLKDGDTLRFDNRTFQIIHTPGHTSGSICIKVDNLLFSGDTLFFRSVGRTDFPTGSFEELSASIKTKLYTLPEDTIVYTGHGDKTSIGEEKKHNEYVPV